MRKFIFLLLTGALMFAAQSCVHAPETAWTPRKSKPIRKHQKKVQSDKKVRVVRMW
jgi:hypothetical protein